MRAQTVIPLVITLLLGTAIVVVLLPTITAEERDLDARVGLRTIAEAQIDFRTMDRDGDSVPNYWVRDVAGLYALPLYGDPANRMKRIDYSIACADASYGNPGYGMTPGPLNETWFAAVERYEDGPGQTRAYDDGSGRNRDRFGFRAFGFGRVLLIDDWCVLYEGRHEQPFPLAPRPVLD